MPVDPRRFIRADFAGLDRPVLCIVIDTEEEFDWRGPFSRRNTLVNAMQGLHRGHEIFARFGLRPAYLLDYPVIADPRTAAIVGPWAEAGACIVGAQLHPWVTPPFEEVVCPPNSFPCNLDPVLERRKLTALTDRIVERLGIAPRVYKAGRYGIDLSREQTLVDLGYTVDTSVLPFRDYTGSGGGPNFFGYPDEVFWSSPERRVLYIPVTHSLVGPLRGFALRGLDRIVFGRRASRLHVPGLLARAGLLERIMLTPEGVSLEDMRRLTRALLRAGHRVFALSLHSPSFVPGGTPYVRTARERDAFLARIEQFLAFFFGELGGRATDPLALRDFLDGTLPVAAATAEPVAVPEPRADAEPEPARREESLIGRT